jgi:hypothetical protein
LERASSNQEIRRIMQAEETVLDRIEAKMVRACDENARREMASYNSLMDPTGRRKRGRLRRALRGGIRGNEKKGGWGKKTPTTGYFGVDWEGSGQPYKPIHNG